MTQDNQILHTDTAKVRIAVYARSSDEVYYREGELPQLPAAQAALKHEELRFGSSVSGIAGRDWKENYIIRSSETGYILFESLV